MKGLLNYILQGLLPNSDFEIEEATQDSRQVLVAKVPKDVFGLVIGKSGNTIRSIRNLLRVRATLDKTLFDLQVEEK